MLNILGPQLSHFSTTHIFSTSVGSLTQASGKQQKEQNKTKFKSTTKYKLYNTALGFIEHKCACFYTQRILL